MEGRYKKYPGGYRRFGYQLLETTQFKDSLGTFIADLVLQILSWMEEEERDRTLKRQREATDVALQNGVPFGRPKAHNRRNSSKKLAGHP